MISWTHPSPHLKRHIDRFSRFAQLTEESPYILYNDRPFPCKLPLRMADLGTTRVHNRNGISIGSAVFDRPTDHATPSV